MRSGSRPLAVRERRVRPAHRDQFREGDPAHDGAARRSLPSQQGLLGSAPSCARSRARSSTRSPNSSGLEPTTKPSTSPSSRGFSWHLPAGSLISRHTSTLPSSRDICSKAIRSRPTACPLIKCARELLDADAFSTSSLTEVRRARMPTPISSPTRASMTRSGSSPARRAGRNRENHASAPKRSTSCRFTRNVSSPQASKGRRRLDSSAALRKHDRAGVTRLFGSPPRTQITAVLCSRMRG